jgi:large subunit ribosomal protein L21
MTNNMKYVILRISGHQYKVSEGQEILVDKLKGGKLVPEVLLFTDGEEVLVGKPVLNEVKVNLKVLGEEKGEKIDVRKYKAKSRYRKHIGFRPQYTRLLVEKITI